MSHTRTWAFLAGLPLLAAGLGVTGQPATATGADRAAAGQPAATPFALKNRGFGTKVVGGEIPAGSSTTAFQRIGCTNKAGKVKRISEAQVDVAGLGVVSGISTTLRTTRRNGVVASTSTQRIAKVVLAESSLGTLSIEALRSRARAFHDGTGFRAKATTDIGRLVLTPAAGEPEELELPSADEPVVIPGLAEIRLGPRRTSEGQNGSFAKATGLIVKVIPSHTTATIGLARAKMNDGVEELLFRGSSSGIQATGLDGAVTKGRTPLSLMPCQGTLGKVQTKSIAGFDLTDAIEVGVLNSEQWANQTRRRASGYERGSVASIDLGNGSLVIEGVVAQANVKRANGKTRFNARGTTVGQITADGEPHKFPDSDVLEIPGVARLEAKVVERQKQVISVVGVRVTLLDGSGAVIDLGTARIGAKRSGR